MKYDYGKALSLSLLFYDAQRTGRLPANNPIGWRGDSFVDDADGIDLEGGWFDGMDDFIHLMLKKCDLDIKLLIFIRVCGERFSSDHLAFHRLLIYAVICSLGYIFLFSFCILFQLHIYNVSWFMCYTI